MFHKVISLEDCLLQIRYKLEIAKVVSDDQLSRAQKEREVRKLILKNSHIIFTTLNSSAVEEISQLSHRIKYLVIDEAAQAVEPSTLIPLQYEVEQCILIGDPKQLPATVFSDCASKCHYGRSMFERLQRNGASCRMLDTQYRIDPLISAYISRTFYDGKVKDGDKFIPLHLPGWREGSDKFCPLTFYNINGRHGRAGNSLSFINESEIRFVMKLYKRIRSVKEWDSLGIGIITPYSAQLVLLQEFMSHFLKTDKLLELNTVDAYQGREFDIIIVSCVRGHNYDKAKPTGLGFLADERRLNVALSRAKRALFIVGNEAVLKESVIWRTLLDYIRENGAYLDASDLTIGFERSINR